MEIKACRICKNKNLIEIGSLGNIAISDFTDRPRTGDKFPLTLVYCDKCTLLQLKHNTPRELLYKNYWYESHLNPVIVDDLKEIASYCDGGSHIDIGANDGTLLKYSQGTVKIAVDPSNIKPENAGVSVQDYWEDTKQNWKVKFITAIACLYDLPDPNKFVGKIKESLESDGLFIAQLMTLQPFIENNDVGNICHEHLEYYSYKSLVRLFEQHGLEIFKVEENNINGGSYRLFVRHFQDGSVEHEEKEYTIQDYKDFFNRLEENKRKMVDFMAVTNNVVGFGASTKMNTILQYYGITNERLKYVVDVNPNKFDKFTIATGIPVVDRIPDDAKYLWVFPYGFIDYFKEKEKDYEGKWITTIPEVKII